MAEKTPASYEVVDADGAAEEGGAVSDFVASYVASKAKPQKPKQKFEMTEVGLIPGDWEVTSLGSSSAIQTGPFGTLLKASEYGSRVGVPLISVGEIGSGRLTITSETPLVPESVIRRLPQYVLCVGDIVFGRKGAVDRSAMIDESSAGYFLGSDGMRVRPSSVWLPRYLAYQVQSQPVQSWLLQNATGTTMASMNQEILKRVLVAVPPTLSEQQAIAAALSDADALLEALDRLIAKKCDIKQAAMQELLTGKRRLPGFTRKWQTKRLGEIGTFSKGSGIRRDQLVAHGVPCIRYGELYTTHTDIIRHFESFIPRRLAVHGTPLRNGDLLFAGSGETAEEIGKCAAFVSDVEAYAGGDIVILTPEGQCSYFLGYLMNIPALVEQKRRLGQGDAVVHIGGKALATLRFDLPKQDEQAAIAAVLSDMDAEIAALESRREKTKTLKQGMMQELLTGRIRLVEPKGGSLA